jgi:hypothetical protein
MENLCITPPGSILWALPPDRAGKAGRTHGKNFEIRPRFLEMF